MLAPAPRCGADAARGRPFLQSASDSRWQEPRPRPPPPTPQGFDYVRLYGEFTPVTLLPGPDGGPRPELGPPVGSKAAQPSENGAPAPPVRTTSSDDAGTPTSAARPSSAAPAAGAAAKPRRQPPPPPPKGA